jgi:BolA family transcriptional regulator, general stress-responsive regulator
MNTERIRKIREALEQALQPRHLEIIDESHLHAGHAGARDGRGHFRVIIESEAFEGLTLVQRHQLVYRAVGDLMTTDVHALGVVARTGPVR